MPPEDMLTTSVVMQANARATLIAEDCGIQCVCPLQGFDDFTGKFNPPATEGGFFGFVCGNNDYPVLFYPVNV